MSTGRLTAADIVAAGTTPLTAPPYARVRRRFTDREYLNVVYRTDPDALRRVVPEPLEVEDDLVRFEVMRMGDVPGFGPYTECGQAIPVSFDGERGEYLHAMYLDSFAGTAAGRESSAYPKGPGKPALRVEEGALVGTLDVGSLRVAAATMAYKHRPMDLAEAGAQITVPTFMVKIVAGYGPRPQVCDLVRTRITDVVVHEAWSGPARLHLFEHVLAPLADLPVREVVAASHVRTDLTLEPVHPVHDYLEDL
ncbi:Acetoacetate decarboxylase [Actinokineospora spheciospongiae]|uniref:Acetoacetate decarboxylase n=1 Tax=Actinokineospora spheciospongiae TaxID=909613 RepID=W7J3D9_9PSEU|nr:Acetoacetate decarboxylase [Actinokineospora spheciospongiae]